MASEKTPIRGLLLERGRLKAVITSDKELPVPVGVVPYVNLYSRNMVGGIPAVVKGERITIRGEGFHGGAPGVGPIRILLRGKSIAREVTVQKDGHFIVEVPINELPGVYELSAEQQDGKRLSRDTARFKVIIPDEPREKVKLKRPVADRTVLDGKMPRGEGIIR